MGKPIVCLASRRHQCVSYVVENGEGSWYERKVGCEKGRGNNWETATGRTRERK